jgi:hypothetical protein
MRTPRPDARTAAERTTSGHGIATPPRRSGPETPISSQSRISHRSKVASARFARDRSHDEKSTDERRLVEIRLLHPAVVEADGLDVPETERRQVQPAPRKRDVLQPCPTEDDSRQPDAPHLDPLQDRLQQISVRAVAPFDDHVTERGSPQVGAGRVDVVEASLDQRQTGRVAPGKLEPNQVLLLELERRKIGPDIPQS